ncbi:MAG: hypothetical protein ABSC42_15915, partial [Tepidisphaeraceae bacterium]
MTIPAVEKVTIENVRRAPHESSGGRTGIWLVPALGLLPFANGADSIPVAAWLAPVFLLRFVRGLRWYVGLPVVYVVLAGALALQFRGMVPLPAMGYIVFLALRGIACVMPYGVDLLLAHRLGGTPGTLVFPLACTVTEWAASHGPAGSWGSAAYSQYGSLAVLQILSVTGVWGVTFLLNWFAP